MTKPGGDDDSLDYNQYIDMVSELIEFCKDQGYTPVEVHSLLSVAERVMALSIMGVKDGDERN